MVRDVVRVVGKVVLQAVALVAMRVRLVLRWDIQGWIEWQKRIRSRQCRGCSLPTQAGRAFPFRGPGMHATSTSRSLTTLPIPRSRRQNTTSPPHRKIPVSITTSSSRNSPANSGWSAPQIFHGSLRVPVSSLLASGCPGCCLQSAFPGYPLRYVAGGTPTDSLKFTVKRSLL